jgi:hypothetical protein
MPKQTKKSFNKNSMATGVNYEAGKIITHILKYSNCVGYANLQIAMDAPYHGRVADEKVRTIGRSELQFPGYDEPKLVANLTQIFEEIIKKHGKDIKIVVQIARGRSAKPTFDEVITPILEELNITNFETKFGYRTPDYYVPTDKTPFFYVNYGMVAIVSNVDKIPVGQICNPVLSIPVLKYNSKKGFTISKSKTKKFNTSKNIMNSMSIITKIRLFGMADDMPFMTPETYSKEHVFAMIN